MSATAPNPEPGDIIEEYEILERIGGNMGFVFKARHRLLDKVVVLKLVPTDCITDPGRLARFQREVRVMGQLEHPNLVTAADARSVDDWHLVAMEWIDGTDLQQLLRARGPLPVAAACEAARQAAQALQYAHEHGLIHRDIKPSNLMLTRSGTLKVIDMGLALIREDSAAQLTKTGLVLGTMSYCAPEQFRDASHVDIRADIYSLGCTLYHLLTGKPPYSERKSFAEVVEAHLHEPFPGLAEAGPDVPSGLEAVLTRMTAKDRDARFSTPGEVVEALEPFARGADLRPLVPERIPQAPTAHAKTVKVTSKREGQRRTAGGEQQPKPHWARRAALLVVLLAIAGGAFLFMKCGKSDPVVTETDPGGTQLSPVVTQPGPGGTQPGPSATETDPVVLMDTTAKDGVYLKETRELGGSNAIEVAKALRDLLPSRSMVQVPITPEWDRKDYVRFLHPRLVIIHRSAFFHTENAVLGYGQPPDFDKPPEDPRWVKLYRAEDKELIFFLALVGAVPHTDFLVYSRGTGPLYLNTGIQEWLVPEYREKWKKDIETDYPDLKGRIHTMVITGGSFNDAVTRATLRNHVRRILNLPGKPEPIPDVPAKPEPVPAVPAKPEPVPDPPGKPEGTE